jgi:hypothetical protein
VLHRWRQRTSRRVVALGPRLRHCVEHLSATRGQAPGERVRHWCEAKKAGGSAVRAAPKMPASSTLLDQAHHAIDRKLGMMPYFHPPGGSHTAFRTGVAPLDTLMPSQRRALHAGQCGVAVEGGRVPTSAWLLTLHILTSGGLR